MASLYGAIRGYAIAPLDYVGCFLSRLTLVAIVPTFQQAWMKLSEIRDPRI